MKNKIVKLILITVASFFSAMIFLWGSVALFAPYGMAKAYEQLGDYKNAYTFYKIDYRRNDKFDRLKNVAKYSILVGDDSGVCKYVGYMFKEKEFECSYKNDSYNNFACSYIKSYYKLGKADCIDKSFELAILYEYEQSEDPNKIIKPTAMPEHNSITTLAITAYKSKDGEMLQTLSDKLSEKLLTFLADRDEDDKICDCLQSALDKVNNYLERLNNNA